MRWKHCGRARQPCRRLASDAIEHWLAPQAVKALYAYGIRTLTNLTIRIDRRRMWWANIPGLGRTGARQIEVFFAQHVALTERARNLVEPPRGGSHRRRLRTLSSGTNDKRRLVT
ncbi:MAG: phage integrase family protein [Burkholderiaceae bacterium]